jgi:hypothetical protein
MLSTGEGSIMHLLSLPVLGAFIWVGGGAVGLIVIILVIVLLLRR